MTVSRWCALAAIVCGPALMAQAPAPGANIANISFTRTVYPILENAQCRGCHSEDGVASGTRLHFPEANASPDEIEAFGLTLAALVDRTDPVRSLLLNKPTNRVRHTGGVRIQPGSFDEDALGQWVRYLAGVSDETVNAARERFSAGQSAAPPDQLLRRLTHSQYNNTVRDLLGDYSRPADRFPPEDFVNGFKNQLRTQGMPPLLAEVYSASAEKLALNAFRAGDVNGLIPCKPLSAKDTRCRDQFVRAFGLRAFRRPLTDGELARYAALFTAQAGKAGGFLDGARVVVEAMLQSPKFLFHVEGRLRAEGASAFAKATAGRRSLGGGRSASPAEARPGRERAEAGPDGGFQDYEIASRLSYFLWDTMPNARLFEAAASGELRTSDGLERVARWMLDQPQARQAFDEFVAEWLRFDRVLSSVKDRRRYPEFTPELAAMMAHETRLLLGNLVWNDGNFMEAFTADYSYLNSDLARLYGVPAPSGEFERTRFPHGARRAGLLGHASFLTSTAGPVETSPTSRGIFIREQLLCQHVPNPPPGVNTEIPEPTIDRPLAMRQRMQRHIESPTCASCHRLMDPIGFGLENYDAVGHWRDNELIEFRGSGRDAQTRKVELPIDGRGEIAGLASSAFSEPGEIGQLLAKSPTCQECVVKQVFRYAFGRLETRSDRETIRRTFAVFRDSGFKFRELLVALVRSPQFVEGLRQP